MQRQFTLSILLSLLLCACAPSNLVSEPSAKPSSTPEPISQVQTTSTGKSREQIEKIDIDNCDGKADITQTAERTQSLDVAVSTEIAAKFGAEAIVKAEIESVIGASISKGGQTKKSIGLTAPPGTHMLFEIAWSDEEEVGIIVNFKGSGLPVNFRRYAPIGVTIKKQSDLGDCKKPQSGSSETSVRPTSTIIPTITPMVAIPSLTPTSMTSSASRELPTNTAVPSKIASVVLTSTPLPIQTNSPNLIFEDKFDDGDSNGWQPAYGSWSVVENRYICVSNASAEGWTFTGDKNWSDYIVTTDVRVFPGGPADVGVLGRVQDAENFYLAELAEGQALLYRRQNKWIRLKAVPYSIEPGTWYKIAIEFHGTLINMYVNDTLVVSIEDAIFLKGRIGLYCGRNWQAYFDNIKVEK